VFYDESGFMLRPLVRQTWSPRGVTPVVRCWDRRDRLSVIGGIIVPRSALRTRDGGPRRHRLSAVFRIHTRNIKTIGATAFLRVLDRHVRGPLIVVQDKLNVHKAGVRRWLNGRPRDAPRVMVEWLPSYAPELNPAEQLWNNSKRVDLANVAPADRDDLRGRVRRSLIRQRCSANLLASAFDHAGLPL
jgi:putative transposase